MLTLPMAARYGSDASGYGGMGCSHYGYPGATGGYHNAMQWEQKEVTQTSHSQPPSLGLHNSPKGKAARLKLITQV